MTTYQEFLDIIETMETEQLEVYHEELRRAVDILMAEHNPVGLTKAYHRLNLVNIELNERS